MAQEVARVARRIEEAKETKYLDLSKCELSMIPEAAYFMLKDTELEKCDLSGNALKRIPTKFCTKFPLLKEIHLQENNITSLPDEMRTLEELCVLNISINKFDNFPSCIYDTPKITTVAARDNKIAEVDLDRLRKMNSLQELDLQDNPLRDDTKTQLSEMKLFTVQVGASDPVGKELDELE